MALGNRHACAFTSAGSLKCWGYNGQGQLGDSTTTNHGNPEYLLSAQSISFTSPPALTAGITTSLAASATSTGPVAFDTWTPTTCSVSGSIFGGYSVTALSIGLCGIRASQSCTKSIFGCPDDGSFADAPQQLRLISVVPGGQTITFGAPPPVGVAGQTRTVSATASSGLAVTFTTLTPTICTVAGNVVSLLTGSASCTIAANQPGNASFSAAPQVTQTFFIAILSQAITFNALSGKTFGDFPFTVTATSSAGLAVTLTSTTTSVCFMSGTFASLIGAGTCTIVATQNGNATYSAADPQTQSFQVAMASQSINFGAIGTKYVTYPPFAISASASSLLPVTFTTSGTCIVSGNTLTLTGAGGCVVYADQAGNANYNPAPQVMRSFTVLPAFTLSVTKAGSGAGSVFSDSGFINCGATCSDGYGSGAVVTLGMVPAAGSNFAGWSGACSGMGTCIVTMDAAKSVTATFQPATVTLTVAKAGTGTGNVLSAPTGIDCGAGCVASFNFNAPVTLIPTASLGSQFTGWSGACSGSGACMVTMDAAKAVTATFALVSNAPSTTTLAFGSPTVPCGIEAPYTVTVSGGFGTPTGTVTIRFPNGTPYVTYPLVGGVRNSSFTYAGYNGVASYYVEYNGNSTYASSQSPVVSLNVIKATPAISLVSDNNPSMGGSSVTLTATVTRVGVCVIPSGTVTFKDGAATIGTAPLDAAGVATLSTSSLSGGSHNLTAEYSGANYYQPLTSSAVTQTVETSLALVAVQSRKTHGAAGIFDLNIDTTQPINGAVTVEPRVIGSGHTMVFQFDGLVSVPGTASVTPVGTANAALSGNDVLVTLANVPDNQRVTVTLVNVNGTLSPPPVTVGFFVGDVNNTRSTNAADISAVKARSGQTATALNFKFDLNATGAINAADISAVKARSGLSLPP